MELAWAPEHVAYRKRLRDVIAAHLPPDWNEKSKFDPGSPYVAAFARSFCPMLAREGLLIPHWPIEHGGGGLDGWHHCILGEEMLGAGEPRSYQYMNVNWIGPTLLRYGTEEQKRYHVRRITAGDVFWCQGFSEPTAGSDLASLRTRAERDGDSYIINGSKIWTSAASFADYCFLLARTGLGRRSISVFLLPMKTPGIEIREVMSMTGRRSLHEVFFTDVRTPASTMLGEESKGWEIVRAALHSERIGNPRYIMSGRALNVAVQVLKREGRFDDTCVQAGLGRARAAIDAARLMSLKVIDSRVKNRPADAFTSVARYALVLGDRAVADFIAEHLSDVLISGDEQPILTQYRRSASTGLGAGAAEIQLNLVSQQYLDLPRDL